MIRPRALHASLVALLLLGCGQGLGPPTSPRELAALEKARDLHWAIESAEGAFIASATAFGPGRLLTNAHAVEDWIGQPLRVRQGSVTHAVRSFGLSVRQDIAVLRVGTDAIAVPSPVDRPKVNDRVIVAGATRHGTFSGAGTVARPPDGMAHADRYVAARLPVLSGFSGAPVVDGEGRLVGIVMSAVVRRHIDSPDLGHHDPAMAIDHRTVLVIPNDVLDVALREERL